MWNSEIGFYGGSKPTIVTHINIDTIVVVIKEGHTSTRSCEAILHIPKLSIYKILTEHLGLRRISSSWVPHHLTSEQMEWRVNAGNKNLQQIVQDSTFLSCVITCDKSWVHYYDRLTEQEWNLAKNGWTKGQKDSQVHQEDDDPLQITYKKWHYFLPDYVEEEW